MAETRHDVDVVAGLKSKFHRQPYGFQSLLKTIHAVSQPASETENSEDATGLSRGDYSRLLPHKAELLGPKTPLLGPKMPRACVAATVNLHGASPWHLWANNSGCLATTVNLHGASPWHLWANNSGCVAATVNLQRASPWHLWANNSGCVAATVSLHGASPWHLWANNSGCVAATVNLHGTSPWHPLGVFTQSLQCEDRSSPLLK